MKASHAAAIKAQAAAESAETLRKIEERLSTIEKMLMEGGASASSPKRAKKSEVEQAASDKPDKA